VKSESNSHPSMMPTNQDASIDSLRLMISNLNLEVAELREDLAEKEQILESLRSSLLAVLSQTSDPWSLACRRAREVLIPQGSEEEEKS